MLSLKSANPHPLLSRGDHGLFSDMWIRGETGDQIPTHRFIFGVSPLLLQVLGEIPASKEPFLILPDFSQRIIDHLLTFLRCGLVNTDGEEDRLALLELLQLLDIDHQDKCKEIENIGLGEEFGTEKDPIKQEKLEYSEYSDEESEMKGSEYANSDEPDPIPPEIIYSCQQCESCFYSSEYLAKHVKSKHKQGDLHCDQCPYVTNDKSNFKHHVNTVHKKLLKFQCDLCSRKFGLATDMERHKNAVHYKLKTFVCEACGVAFAQKVQLSSHVRKIHTGEKPFCCGKCAVAFASPQELKRHEKLAHGVKG